MKRWVAYERTRGRTTLPRFLIEAEDEREALCLASDLILLESAPGQTPGLPWAGPMVHVRLADEAPAADVAMAEQRLAAAN